MQLTYSNHAERLHYVTDPIIAGNMYGDVRRLASNAVVVGYQRADGSETKLNPSDWDTLSAGDRLLVVSKDARCNFATSPIISGARLLCLPLTMCPTLVSIIPANQRAHCACLWPCIMHWCQ